MKSGFKSELNASMDDDDGKETVSLTEIRKKEIYLRLRMNLGVSIATVIMAILQLCVAVLMGAQLFELAVHDYYLMMIICGLAAILAGKYRKLILGGWMTTLVYAYSNLCEVALRSSILQSIVYNGVVMMFPIFFNFKMKDTILTLSINFLFLIGSIIASIIRFDDIQPNFTRGNITLEMVGCAATLAITQLISMMDHKIRGQMESFMRSTLGLEGRNKVLLISDNAIFTENLVACLKGKGIEMLHTMYLKKGFQTYKTHWKKIGICVIDSVVLGESGHLAARDIRAYETQRGVAPVIIFALVEKQSKIIKQRKKLKKNKRKGHAKTEGAAEDIEEAEKQIELAAQGSRTKWAPYNVTKFMEHPVSVDKLAIEIQTLDFA